MDLRTLPGYRPDAPGAVLDEYEWAASWATFLQAVSDPKDASARRVISNAWSERVPSEGGFLAPEGLRAQVMAYMTPRVVRPRALVMPMGAYRLGLPQVDNPSQASSGGVLGGLTFSFTEEGGTIPSSTPGLGRTMLEARKLAALFTAPNELTTDAAGAMSDFLSRVIAMGLAWTEDDFFIANGTGVGQPESIMNAGCAKTVTRTNSGSAPVAADIAAMVSALHPAALAAALTPGVTDVCWLVSKSVLGAWLEMYLVPGGSAATAGAPASLPSWLGLGDGHEVGPSIIGLPALVTDHQPAVGHEGDLMLADLRNYAIGDRLALTVEASDMGAGFATDSSQFKVRSRVDGRYWIQTSTTTEASQSVSPVVVLK